MNKQEFKAEYEASALDKGVSQGCVLSHHLYW